MKPEKDLEERIQYLEKKTLYLSITLLVVTIIYSYVLTDCLYHYLQVRSYLQQIDQAILELGSAFDHLDQTILELGPVLDELLNYLK